MFYLILINQKNKNKNIFLFIIFFTPNSLLPLGLWNLYIMVPVWRTTFVINMSWPLFLSGTERKWAWALNVLKWTVRWSQRWASPRLLSTMSSSAIKRSPTGLSVKEKPSSRSLMTFSQPQGTLIWTTGFSLKTLSLSHMWPWNTKQYK